MDHRDAMANYGRLLPPHTFDESKMLLTMEFEGEGGDVKYEFPCDFQVCGTCDGKGKHVNPSIDAHGITQDEFYEDPGFEEAYMEGQYDVSCYECNGKRVMPHIRREHIDDKILQFIDEWIQDEISFRAECEFERRMGA